MVAETYITVWKITESKKNGKLYASFTESNKNKDGVFSTTYTGTAKVSPEVREVIKAAVKDPGDGKKPCAFGKARIGFYNMVDKDTKEVSPTFCTIYEFEPYEKEEKKTEEPVTELPF